MTDQSVNELLSSNNLQVPTSQVVLVSTQWNRAIVDELERGALALLAQFPTVKITVYRVPGAVEIPHAIYYHRQHVGADAYIALGCVIRGETPHFDVVAGEAARGLMEAMRDYEVPVTLGLLTTDTLAQAEARAGGAHGNKGEDAALAVLELLDLLDRAVPGDAGEGA
jgi:6,7-dimethyl-8-ribityllumazine synthase